jgi:hypothetical protein
MSALPPLNTFRTLSAAMMTPQAILGYVRTEPFRPFRVHLASGRTFDIRHPEMIKVLRSNLMIFKATADNADLFDEWESVSLMLTESISHPDAQVH